MFKGSFLDIATIIFVLGLIVVGVYSFLNMEDEVSIPSAVENTSSYQNLQQYDDLNKTRYNVTSDTIAYSKNHDFPYNFSNSSEVGEAKSIFAVVVDFGEFNETESQLFIVNSGIAGEIYQLKDGEIITQSETYGPFGEYNQASNKRQMCLNSQIHIDSVNFKGTEIEVNVSNPGSSDFNADYRGDINVTLTPVNGENITKNKNTVLAQDSRNTYLFKFNSVTGKENVEKITLNPLTCQNQRQEAKEFPVQ